MALPSNVTNREYNKFIESSAGNVAVRTVQVDGSGGGDLIAPFQAGGIDAVGANSYTTVVTASSNATHMKVSLEGSNGAIISIDSGTTDGIYIPANSAWVFDQVAIASGATVQGKNATPGSNYTKLAITIW